MTWDLSLPIGFARDVYFSLRGTCHVSAFGFVDPIRFCLRELSNWVSRTSRLHMPMPSCSNFKKRTGAVKPNRPRQSTCSSKSILSKGCGGPYSWPMAAA